MPKCKWCRKKGVFLSVSKNGLCNQCEVVVGNDIRQRGRIVIESLELIKKSKKMDTRLSRCDLLVDHLKELRKYEEKGITTLDPKPSALIAKHSEIRDEIILDGVKDKVEKAINKAKVAVTPNTSIGEANKALLFINEWKKELAAKSALDSLEAEIQRFIHEKQLNTYLEAADKAKFKGNTKKAIDQYQEALYLLRRDNIDDSLQTNKIKEIEEKIDRLQNR